MYTTQEGVVDFYGCKRGGPAQVLLSYWLRRSCKTPIPAAGKGKERRGGIVS